MGSHSRNKGARGELEVAKILAAVYPKAERSYHQARSGSDASDVEGTPWFVECKIGKRPNIRGAFTQCCAATDGRPVLVCTREDRAEWLVTLKLADFVRLVSIQRQEDLR